MAGAGRIGLSLLLPGPEDAIMLMVQFAGSYQEAWDIIEQRNTRSGIAMGIAAGMLGLDWEWVQQHVWRRFATPDVATHVMAAVGKAERSYNDGLARGYKYGAGHPHGLNGRGIGYGNSGPCKRNSNRPDYPAAAAPHQPPPVRR